MTSIHTALDVAHWGTAMVAVSHSDHPDYGIGTDFASEIYLLYRVAVGGLSE